MEKIPFSEKLAYGLGDSACNFIWSTISAFLTIYYTDSVGLAAFSVGTLMLVTRLLDGFSDLAMGTVIEKTNTRFGKARPWVIISAPLMSIGLILLFSVPMGLGDTGKLIYAYITYIFISVIAYTMCNLSYSAMGNLMTSNPIERTTITSIRMMFATGTGLALAILTPSFVNKFGFNKVMTVYAIIAFIMLCINFACCKERIIVAEDKKSSDLPLKEALKLLFQNKYFPFATILFVSVYITGSLCSGGTIYYSTYILGSNTYYGLLTAASILPVIIGLPFVTGIVKKMGRVQTLKIGFIVQAIGFLLVFFVGKTITLAIISFVIVGIGKAFVTSNIFALVGDIIDYGQWKTGVRLDGLTNSITSFGMKVGTGLGAASIGWILAFGNYQANTVQEPSAELAIRALVGLIPAIVVIINVVITCFCDLDKVYVDVVKDLKSQNDNTNM